MSFVNATEESRKFTVIHRAGHMEGAEKHDMTTPAKTAGGTETGEDSGYKTLQKAPQKTAPAGVEHHTRPSRPNQRSDKIRTGHYYDFIQRNIQNIAVMVILSSFCFGLFIGKLANKETRNMR